MSRLTKEQLEARGLVLAGMVSQEATVAALRAENARLREALEEADQWLSSRVISNFTRDLRGRIAALLSCDSRAAS